MSRAFDAAYSEQGRPSIPPEQPLKALLLQALYSIPSERRLVDAINWNLLYRWFCDLDPDAAVWDATTFTKNRERFERHGLVQKFFDQVVKTALVEDYVSNDHFTVDGTLIQSWASLKSFRPKDEPQDKPPAEGGSNPSVDFRGTKRTNETHQSTTDPEARLARKSSNTAALLCHSAQGLMENRHGLCLDIRVAAADGHAERADHFPAGDECQRGRRGTTPDAAAHENPRLPDQPARTQKDRADVRLAETGRWAAQSASRGPLEDPAGRLPVGGSLQSAAAGKSGSTGCRRVAKTEEQERCGKQNADAREAPSDSARSFFHSWLHPHLKNHPFFSTLLGAYQSRSV